MFEINRAKMAHALRFAAAVPGGAHSATLLHICNAIEAMPREDFVEFCQRAGGVWRGEGAPTA